MRVWVRGELCRYTARAYIPPWIAKIRSRDVWWSSFGPWLGLNVNDGRETFAQAEPKRWKANCIRIKCSKIGDIHTKQTDYSRFARVRVWLSLSWLSGFWSRWWHTSVCTARDILVENPDWYTVKIQCHSFVQTALISDIWKTTWIENTSGALIWPHEPWFVVHQTWSSLSSVHIPTL